MVSSSSTSVSLSGGESEEERSGSDRFTRVALAPGAGLRRIRRPALYHRPRKLEADSQNIPSSKRAASDIIEGFQEGSPTSSTPAAVPPGPPATLAWTSPGNEPATGQPGEVRVILTLTTPSSWMSTS